MKIERCHVRVSHLLMSFLSFIFLYVCQRTHDQYNPPKCDPFDLLTHHPSTIACSCNRLLQLSRQSLLQLLLRPATFCIDPWESCHVVFFCVCRRLWSCLATKPFSGLARPRRSTCWVHLIRSAGLRYTFSHIHILFAISRITTVLDYT